MKQNIPDLPDLSVWISLSSPAHIHYARACHYWEEEASETLAFCRITFLGLLRSLTNPHIFGKQTLDGQSAWRAVKTWLSHPRVRFFDEPLGIEDWLERWSREVDLSGGDWTDAYLAAFAAAGGYRLVAFDKDFFQFKGSKLLHLKS
jgi:toxin-antitoxin system PIN domain toxin